MHLVMADPNHENGSSQNSLEKLFARLFSMKILGFISLIIVLSAVGYTTKMAGTVRLK